MKHNECQEAACQNYAALRNTMNAGRQRHLAIFKLARCTLTWSIMSAMRQHARTLPPWVWRDHGMLTWNTYQCQEAARQDLATLRMARSWYANMKHNFGKALRIFVWFSLEAQLATLASNHHWWAEWNASLWHRTDFGGLANGHRQATICQQTC